LILVGSNLFWLDDLLTNILRLCLFSSHSSGALNGTMLVPGLLPSFTFLRATGM
jgi:hypothetical protein